MEIGDDGVKIGKVEPQLAKICADEVVRRSAVAFCDGDLHRGSGTEVEPLGF